MDEQRTQRIPMDATSATEEALPTTSEFPVTTPPAQTPAEDGNNAEPRRKRWPIVVAVVVVVALIASGVGFFVYRDAQRTALASCRSAVTEFSKARKDPLATTEDAPEGEQLIRRILGVDKVLDAFADAMSAAEGTITNEACASNATPIQLNIVANTVRSTTDSLNESVDKINAEIKSETKQGLQDWLKGLVSGGSIDGTSVDSNTTETTGTDPDSPATDE